jgi:hypothetical protein
MDGECFDRIARLLGEGTSRRAGIGAALGGVLGLAGRGTMARRKVKPEGVCGFGKDARCTKGTDCCTGVCNIKVGRCRCSKRGQSCVKDANCCDGKKQGLACQGTKGNKTCQPKQVACGGEGQACCTGPSCNEGLSCEDNSGQKTCVACDVFCASGNRVACGAALNQALGNGGTIRVCPGEYEGPFPLTVDVEITGSGSGNDPSVDTILVGGGGLGSVVPVTSATTALLASLRITGGNGSGTNSGGVYVNNAAANVTIDGCALVGNAGFYGGGASVYSGALTIIDSEVSGNSAGGSGGGVATATTSTIESTSITGNTAALSGGGVFVNSGTATLGSGVSITGNASNGGAGTGGGIYKFTAGATINNSATVTNNTPDDCAGNGFTCP